MRNYEGEIWFDVDMENLTLGNANLFAYVLNQSTETKQLILRIQTPDFRPNECVYGLKNTSCNEENNIKNHDSIANRCLELYHPLRLSGRALSRLLPVKQL